MIVRHLINVLFDHIKNLLSIKLNFIDCLKIHHASWSQVPQFGDFDMHFQAFFKCYAVLSMCFVSEISVDIPRIDEFYSQWNLFSREPWMRIPSHKRWRSRQFSSSSLVKCLEAFKIILQYLINVFLEISNKLIVWIK